MNIVRILITILIGVVSGIIGGSLGQVGSFVILPCLLMSGVIGDFKTAVGTILFAMLPPVSILAVVEYYKNKKIDIPIGIVLCISYLIAAKFGAIINKKYTIRELMYASSALFFIVSIYFFINARKQCNSK